MKTNRRQFLRRSAAACGVTAAATVKTCHARASSESPPETELKISILSYSFRGLLAAGKMDVFGYLESCKYRYGLEAADLWNGFLPTLEPSYLKKVREALEARELDLADLAVDKAHIWEDDPGKREENYQNALAHLEAARQLKARFVRFDAGGRGRSWSEGAFDHIVKRYKEYARFAYDHGFKVGAENHWGPEAIWSNMQKLYHAVDHPAFGISCHLGGWTGSEEEKARADREVAPWVCHTHIAWSITSGPLLVKKLANLWRAGYAGYYSVEHHSGENEYAEVGIQLQAVRQVPEQFRDKGVPET
jgi:hypothetical protein